MVPERRSLAEWLVRLDAERLIVLNPQITLDTETLWQTWVRRGKFDPAEMSHALASLLAKDPVRWRQIVAHFHQHFGVHAEMPKGPGSNLRTLLAGEPKTAIAPIVVKRSRLRRLFLRARRWVRRLPNKARVIVLVAAVISGIVIAPRLAARLVPNSSTTPWLQKALNMPPARIITVEKHWSLEPKRGPLRKTVRAAESKTVLDLPGPQWLRVVMSILSALLGLVAVRWWFASDDYASDVQRAAEKSAKTREELLKQSHSVGIPYHIERVSPMSTHAIEDAATLLGRITRHEDGLDLDIQATIDQTIHAGGRVVPVHARSHRRDALIVLVDVEDGEHPYLDGVEWVLEQWQRLGVKFVRYDYCERPRQIISASDRRAITLDALARKTEGAPLLIISRMVLPQDYDGQLSWLRTMDTWPVRAWLDVDPRPLSERPRSMRRVVDRIAAAVPRYPFVSKGLLACATALSMRGKTRIQEDNALRPITDPDVDHALRLWAAAACCVPDPTWAHLDSLRRALPEVVSYLPDLRYVQRLVDWVNTHGYGETTVGSGGSLRFKREARVELIGWLRGWDGANSREDARVEHIARKLLILQLQAADVENDSFEQARRQMKLKVHEAILDPSKAESLLAEFADGAVAPELRELLSEELELQAHGALFPGKRPWSGGLRDAMMAWTTGKGVRARDLFRWRGPTGAQWSLLILGLCLAGVSWVVWWSTQRHAPVPLESNHLLPATYRVAEERPIALADVAPMLFVILPNGQFLMGSAPGERARNDDESPQHSVEVRSFELSAREVTQKQWRLLMGQNPAQCAHGCGDDLPVQNVSWYDTLRFMNRLTDRENSAKPPEAWRSRCYDETTWRWDRACTGYRLPTEAEWEYAARAGSTTAYAFGDDPAMLCEYGNGADIATMSTLVTWYDCNETCNDHAGGLSAVGAYRPNAWGLLDMHGNVYEWVWDVYAPYAVDRLYEPLPPPDALRVLRGGSFLSDPGTMRSAYRRGGNPQQRNMIMGVRCARSSDPSVSSR